MTFLLRALSNGTDGVFIGGCHLGDCHYNTHGNYQALNMVLLCKRILKHIGLNPERLRIDFMSAGEGIRFTEFMNDFGSTVKKLGPLGQGEDIDQTELKLKLKAVTQLIPYIRLVLNERLRVHFDTKEEYIAFYSSDEFDHLFDELIADKLAISQIMLLLGEKPLSTDEISKLLDLTPSEVSRHINSSARQGLVKYEASQKHFARV